MMNPQMGGLGTMMGLGILNPVILANQQAQFYPTLMQNLNNQFVRLNPWMLENAIFVECMKANLVDE